MEPSIAIIAAQMKEASNTLARIEVLNKNMFASMLVEFDKLSSMRQPTFSISHVPYQPPYGCSHRAHQQFTHQFPFHEHPRRYDDWQPHASPHQWHPSRIELLKVHLMIPCSHEEVTSYAELEIDSNEELDGMTHDKFDIDEDANEDFKVEEEDQDHTQQEDYHSPLQDNQDPTQ
jgi:hypothetical protein